MQRETKVDIDDREIIVRELSIRQIRQIVDDLDRMDGEKAMEILAMCSNLTLADLESENMYPSDLRKIWDKWAEVNSDFLFVIRAAWKRPAVQQMVDALLSEILTAGFSDLLNGGTPAPGITGSGFSSPAFPNPTEPTGNANATGSSG